MTLRIHERVAKRLLDVIGGENLPFGREDSIKFTDGQMRSGRLMLGVRTIHAPLTTVRRIAEQLGMPPSMCSLLEAHHAQADVVLFGAEPGPQHTMFKVYLEFWEHVRQQVLGTGSRAPQLLDLGLKWEEGASTGRVARYWCHPLLSVPECLDRLRLVYGVDGEVGPDHALVGELVKQAAQHRPGASFIYMDVAEEGTPRQSFDLNLYKTGWRLGDVQPWLLRVQQRFQLPSGPFNDWMDQTAGHPLGHISGGLDRHGQAFLTVYYERQPLA
jgi:hypothetical protein